MFVATIAVRSLYFNNKPPLLVADSLQAGGTRRTGRPARTLTGSSGYVPSNPRSPTNRSRNSLESCIWPALPALPRCPSASAVATLR